MARMNWAMICSVPKNEDLGQLKDFGKWFTTNVHKYGIKLNQLYNFADEPVFLDQLESCSKSENGTKSLELMYKRICREYPSVAFVLHILPHKNSIEFEKMKQLTCLYQLIGQGILVENARSKFAGADELAVFNNVNQYIARRFAQIVDLKHDKREVAMLIKRKVVPSMGRVGRSYHCDDLHSTVSTVLHSEKTTKLVQVQTDSKHFRNSAIICGLPEQYTRYQVASMFSQWVVADVMLTTRSSAYIDFFDPNAVHQAKAHYDEVLFKDPETNVEYKVTVSPIQSRHLSNLNAVVLEKKEEATKTNPFRDLTNQATADSVKK